MRKIQRTPFSTARVLPGPTSPVCRRLGRNIGSSTAHWASVRSMHWIYAISHNSQPRNRLHVFVG